MMQFDRVPGCGSEETPPGGVAEGSWAHELHSEDISPTQRSGPLNDGGQEKPIDEPTPRFAQHQRCEDDAALPLLGCLPTSTKDELRENSDRTPQDDPKSGKDERRDNSDRTPPRDPVSARYQENNAATPLLECLLTTAKNLWTDDSCDAVIVVDRLRTTSLITKELVRKLNLPAASTPTADFTTSRATTHALTFSHETVSASPSTVSLLDDFRSRSAPCSSTKPFFVLFFVLFDAASTFRQLSTHNRTSSSGST
ncbi:hypothetical protein AAVH_39822 [Aphelenchoides avenae]|nr:hypothetical protein AAVH_39822 [Aphelenchus avenae]